jgi:hypothetical protein
MKTSLIVLVALALLILGILVALKRRGAVGTSAEAWPFYAKRPLTAPEQILYFRLVRALPDHIVLAQVQVSRVLGVKKGFGFNHWSNRINRLSYDFVVCSNDASVSPPLNWTTSHMRRRREWKLMHGRLAQQGQPE